MRDFQIALVSVLLLLPSTTFAQDAEKRIKRSDLPAAVEKTVGSEAHGAKILGFSVETENGASYYEAALKVDGHSKDVLIDGKGKVVEVEEEVAFDSLPANVKHALQAKAADAKIAKVESLTKDGVLVAYEAHIRRGGKSSEVQVGPDGGQLLHEE